MVMTLVALTGTVSHFALGANFELISGLIIIVTCLSGAVVSARYANRCNIKKLNYIVGVSLIQRVYVSAASTNSVMRSKRRRNGEKYGISH